MANYGSLKFGAVLSTPTANTTLGSETNTYGNVYLSSNAKIHLGANTFAAPNIFPFNLDISPEVLTIQVAAPDAGDDTTWLWTWATSTLPYARSAITNSPQTNVPLYQQGTYTLNNFAANETFGNMTQTHDGYFKWIDGAGTQNLVSWAVNNGNFNVTHPSINGGASTSVERYTITVPSTLTLPTLNTPSATYAVSFISMGSYQIGENAAAGIDHHDSAANGPNKNLGPFYRGGTYTFNLHSSIASHPFYLTTDNGTGFVAGSYIGEYTNGVTGSRNNGTTGKTTLTFTVPQNAPDTLFYQCGVHSSMRGAITIKDLAVETNINGNYVIYFQHTGEGHKTPIEIRPIPSLVNQMCVVYDASVNKFVPQDLATYVENTPSFKNKIREVAGTATLVAADGVAVVPTVLVVEDTTYLPLVNNKEGDIAFDAYTDTIYVWQGNTWNYTKPTTFPAANVTGQVGNALVSGTVYSNAQPNITSVGTLTNLAVGGNLTVTGNLTVSGTTTTINSTTVSVNDLDLILANNANTAAAANGAGIIINGANASMTYASSSNAFVFTHKISANGALLTSITGANVTGQVANALVATTATTANSVAGANVTGQVANALISGTVYTNAQPNITSVGTLSSLAVNGTSNLSAVGNVVITGGSTGQYLTTNGSGVLSWTSPSGGGATISAVAASATYYLGLSANTSGTWTDARVDTGNLSYNSGTQTLYSTNYNTSSDANLKTNVHTIENALDIVNLLRGVGFDWIATGLKSYGIIAQELEQHIPDLVTIIDGKRTVNYDALVGFLIEAIKTQSTQIQSLEERITKLELK